MQKYTFKEGVTLLGGGPTPAGSVAAALDRAPRLICADGGANHLDIAVARPDAIIGDFDSVENLSNWREVIGDRAVHVAEQDSTDLEKCLARVAAPYFIGAGFLGGRVDHELGALHALIADPRPIVLIGERDVAFSAGAGVDLALTPGDRLSIFPLAPVRAAATGVEWAFDDLALAAGGRIGVSNRVAAPDVRLRFDRAGAIILLPAHRLDAALNGARNLPSPQPLGDTGRPEDSLRPDR